MLDRFKHEPTPPSSKQSTPTSTRALRRALTDLQKDHNQLSTSVERILHASEKLAFKNEILLHENKALVRALHEEKKRRKRGKALGLFDKEKPGEAQFFSPSKVAAARQRANEIEAEKQEKIAQTEANKLERAIQKEQKAREAEEKKAAREKAQMEARDCREKEKAQRAEAKAQRQQQQAAKKLAQEQAREQRKIKQQEKAAKRKNNQSKC